VGETATLHFAQSRIHLFDPETGRALVVAVEPEAVRQAPG
jgi:hypothetical protein